MESLEGKLVGLVEKAEQVVEAWVQVVGAWVEQERQVEEYMEYFPSLELHFLVQVQELHTPCLLGHKNTLVEHYKKQRCRCIEHKG